MSSSTDTVRKTLLMRRRDFLVLGSAAVAGTMATNLPAAVARAVRPASDSAQLSFGFWDGSVRGGEARRSALRSPIAAEALPMGDPRFISAGARVSVLGFWRAAKNRSTPLAISVGAWYTVPAAGKVPFVAWTYSDNRNGAFSSGRSPFLVPVDTSGALELSVEASRPAIDAVGSMVATSDLSTREKQAAEGELATFTLNYARGLKLQPGVYIVAVQQHGDRVPDWSSLEVADLTKAESLDRNGSGPLTQSHLIGSSAPDFDYLLVNVELGSARTR